MTWWRRVPAWLRARPTTSDALFGLLLLPPAAMGRVNALQGPPTAPTPASAVLVVATCAAIAVRRRYPVAVWASALVMAVLIVLLQHGPSSALVPFLITLYTVAARLPARRAVAASLLSAAALLLAQALTSSDRWDRASTYIVATFCGLAGVVGIAVRNQRRVLAQARERARVAEESREEEAQRRVTGERLRIARELHDVVAHHIAVINVQSGVAEHLQSSNPAAAREALRHVRESSGQVLEEMSALLGVLRDGGDADSGGREPARGLADLDGLVDSLRRTGLQVVVRQEGRPGPLEPLVDVTAYRVVEEALTNAHKHGSGSAQLTLVHRPSSTTIEVRNDVRAEPLPGSSAARDAGRGTGQGLIGMRERVTAVGGSLHIGTDRPDRFAVHVELPAGDRAAPVRTGGDRVPA